MSMQFVKVEFVVLQVMSFHRWEVGVVRVDEFIHISIHFPLSLLD